LKNDITGSESAFGIANILQKAQPAKTERQSQMTLPSEKDDWKMLIC